MTLASKILGRLIRNEREKLQIPDPDPDTVQYRIESGQLPPEVTLSLHKKRLVESGINFDVVLTEFGVTYVDALFKTAGMKIPEWKVSLR